MTEETLVPLDESDLIAHCERQDQKIRELEAALAEKDKVAKTVEKMWLKRVTEYEAVMKSLKCKGLEICEIMKGQTRQVANLKEDFEAMARTAGLQAEQIAALTKQNKILEIKNKGTLTNNLCPDCRDKQAGKPCLGCTIQTLTAERDRQNDFINKVEMAYPEFYEHHREALRGEEGK